MKMWLFYYNHTIFCYVLDNVVNDFGKEGLEKIIVPVCTRTGFGCQGRDSWQLFHNSWSMKVCYPEDPFSCELSAVREIVRIQRVMVKEIVLHLRKPKALNKTIYNADCTEIMPILKVMGFYLYLPPFLFCFCAKRKVLKGSTVWQSFTQPGYIAVFSLLATHPSIIL